MNFLGNLLKALFAPFRAVLVSFGHALGINTTTNSPSPVASTASASQSVSPENLGARAAKSPRLRRFFGGVGPEKRTRWPRRGLPRLLSLTGIDVVPPPGNSHCLQRRRRRQPAACLWVCGLTCEQSALLGPVERQIKPGQTRRGKLYGLSTLKDCLD